ncbi:hypothetical protein SNE40_008900 [Patella caerulea]|uniref:gamma-glutamylcyclotransferase n=1 Tax=Patella caerulea TaxID=87958 RepID=A0AAN8JW93_PATCE
MGDENIWSFGYGSNMDVHAVETKKQVKILDHTAAILKGWRLAFNLSGIPFVEPAFANIIQSGLTDEVHGVAFCISKESVANMDKVEIGYDKAKITLEAYDGRTLHGFVYVNKPSASTSDEMNPSKRYIGVLIKGAQQAGLKPSYIDKLRTIKTYIPSSETLQTRSSLPKPEDLPPITVEELAKYKGTDSNFPSRVAVFGYVFQPKVVYFQSHRGRERTSRFLMQYHGLPLDDNDDGGRPPYPLVDKLTQEEKEYVFCWLDHYLSSSKTPLGYLSEFREQQKSGVSSWTLPQK